MEGVVHSGKKKATS